MRCNHVTQGNYALRPGFLCCTVSDCRRSPSPVERHHRLHGTKQRPRSCCEGYTHGSLTTADIQGARPASRQKQHLPVQQTSQAEDLSALADINSSSAQPTAAAAVCRPNLLGMDPGMHPRVLIPRSTNRPDLTHSTADIEGAQPCPKDVCHHPRDTNPLSPAYRLASGRSVRCTKAPQSIPAHAGCVPERVPQHIPGGNLTRHCTPKRTPDKFAPLNTCAWCLLLHAAVGYSFLPARPYVASCCATHSVWQTYRAQRRDPRRLPRVQQQLEQRQLGQHPWLLPATAAAAAAVAALDV